MEWWQLILVVALIAIVLLAIAAWLIWRKASTKTHELSRRLQGLPWRSRLSLGFRLMGDERIPLLVRAIPPLLIVYLAMPLDIVPDFFPIIGQLDDIAVVFIALGLLVRFIPIAIIETHITDIEAEAAVERSRDRHP